MIEFPSTTVVNRILPKDKFVEHLDLTPNLKKKLISDIVHIKILNKFSKSVLGFRDFEDPFTTRLPSWRSRALPTSCWSSSPSSVTSPNSEALGAGLNGTKMLPHEGGEAGEQSETEGVLSLEEKITEVLLLQIDLKKPDFDSKLIEAIARQNPHKLVFLLRYLQYAKLAVFYKKLYIGSWRPFEEVSLTLNGNNMNNRTPQAENRAGCRL